MMTRFFRNARFFTSLRLNVKQTFFVLIVFSGTNAFCQVPSITSFAPTSAAMGNTVVITGTSFTGATSVSFGGVNATSFTVVSSTQINAIVPLATAGSVNVTTPVQTATKTGFYYLPLSGIITDYAGYWATTTTNNNSVFPDNSHNLLGFTYNGVTYSTGVNNGTLTGQGVNYTAAIFKSLPVANIAGTNSASSIYLAMGSKVDGNVAVANASALAGLTIKDVMTDGINGLNLGTGITNLPASATMTFGLTITHPEKITDEQPDIVITQIADPSTANDVFQFVNSAGTIVGNSITQNMNMLTKLGTYYVDLFNLGPGDPFNSAACYSAFQTNSTKDIRLVAFKLSDFGITSANYSQVVSLKITPSGTSDYAFIAYSDGLDMYPNISQNAEKTNTAICSGGTANLEVITSAASGGTLSYLWQELTNGGTSWATVNNGGNYSGATTNKLVVSSATNNYKYRAVVTESGTGYSSTSPVFTISVSTPLPPVAAVVSGSGITCLNTLVSLSAAVTNGSNLFYQWQSDASGTFTDIPDAILKTYLPPVNATATTSYRVRVSSGSGCLSSVLSLGAAISVVGISSTTPASRCGTGLVTLGAMANLGTVSWYAASTGGTALATGTTYSPTISATTTYYVSTDASQCTSAARVPVTATINAISWAGTNTTDWSTLANWDCGGVPPTSLPTSSNNVTIPTTPTGGRFPVVGTTAPINNITIAPGASITVGPAGVFEIYGAISNSGTFTATAGTISMRGTAQQVIPANVFATNTIKNLTVNNTSGVLLGGSLNITGTYTPTAGVLTTFGYLTLKSNAAGTARVAPGTGTYINGNVNVERYIPQRRSWRLMTAPLTNSNTFYESWQNNGIYEAGKGLLVTAPVAGIGIDATGNSSLKTWNSTTQSTQIVYNTKVPISASNNGSADNTGYFIFIRGDRYVPNIDHTLTLKNVTTLTSTGYLQTGTQSFTNLPTTAGNLSLIGNPYASPLDFNLVLANSGTSNVKRKFYVWDPQLNSVGGYVVLDDAASTGVFMPTPATSSQGNYLQSGQAFFIVTNAAGSASLEIKESNKAATNNTNIFGKPMVKAPSFIANLFIVTDSSLVQADGAKADFNDGFSDGVDDDDNLKFTNVHETFGFLRNNIFLATERKTLETQDTLFLKVNRYCHSSYQAQFTGNGFNTITTTAVLQDSYTGINTPLDLSGLNKINFAITEDAASKAADRFRIVFNKKAPLVMDMPVIKASRKDEDVVVEWKIENEENIRSYEVERSGDDSSFSTIKIISTNGTNLLNKKYDPIDDHPTEGNNFYRIKVIGTDGGVQYTQSVKVIMGNNVRGISVYPNPVVNKSMHIQLTGLPAGSYLLSLTNSAGQLLMKANVDHAGGTAAKDVRLPGTVSAGNYQLKISGEDSFATCIKILVR